MRVNQHIPERSEIAGQSAALLADRPREARADDQLPVERPAALRAAGAVDAVQIIPAGRAKEPLDGGRDRGQVHVADMSDSRRTVTVQAASPLDAPEDSDHATRCTSDEKSAPRWSSREGDAQSP